MPVDEAVKYKAESGSRFGTSVTPKLNPVPSPAYRSKVNTTEQSVLRVALLNNGFTAAALKIHTCHISADAHWWGPRQTHQHAK